MEQWTAGDTLMTILSCYSLVLSCDYPLRSSLMAAVGGRCLYREAALATIAVSSGGGSLGDYYWEPGEKETGSPVRAILTEHYSLHFTTDYMLSYNQQQQQQHG